MDVEYQVPTSSQRDQDDVIVVDSDEEVDEGMADEGNAADEGNFEDDGAENFEEYNEQEQEMGGYDEGPDIDDDNNIQSANNEVEIDDVPQLPNQSGSSSSNQAQAAAEAGSSTTSSSTNNNVGQTTSTTNEQSSQSASTTDHPNQSEANQQQIQSISSGSEAGPSTSGNSPMGSSSSTQWRQSQSVSSRQHTAHLMLTPQNYDETSDDRIVPSTPTLYINRRSDG